MSLASALSAQPAEPEPTREKPYHEYQLQELTYSGPENAITDPSDLEEVALGWFGPGDPNHALHGDLWIAATMAIDEANSAGGYHGVPFALLARWSENPWGSGVAEVARLAYEDRVWALLGSVDGPGTHLAEQVVAKARLPLVSPVSTDPSVNLAGVPWMFSLAPSDALWSGALIDRLLEDIGTSDFVLLAATDHDSRFAAQAMLAKLAERGRGPSLRADLSPDLLEAGEKVVHWIDPIPAAVLVAAGPMHSARLVRSLRKAGFDGPVYGTPQMGRAAFLLELGEPEAKIVFPDLLPSGTDSHHFVENFREKTGREPDWAAFYTYDATQLLLAAIERAGLDRTRIRDLIAAAPLWKGITGTIDWDPVGQNRSEIIRTRAIP